MAYTCPTCKGTGKVSGATCPRCLGHTTLIEDAQGLAVAWGTVDLGRLTNFKRSSAKVSTEDVTGLNSPTVQFTNATGNSHKGMVRQLIAGDVTPGTVSVSWIGKNGLTDAMIGHAKTLTVTHTGHNTLAGAFAAILMEYDQDGSVGGLVEGSATFQLTGV